MSEWGTKESEGGKAGQQGGSNATPESSNPAVTANFDNLYAQKRSMDPVSTERREKLADQRPKGVISNLMSKFVSGPGGSTEAGK